MMRTVKIGLLAAAFAFAGTAGALAQGRGPCLPRADAIAKLEQHYGEHQVGVGIGTKGSSVIELYVAETGTWTILITRTNGMSCVAASGENWTQSALVVGENT